MKLLKNSLLIIACLTIVNLSASTRPTTAKKTTTPAVRRFGTRKTTTPLAKGPAARKTIPQPAPEANRSFAYYLSEIKRMPTTNVIDADGMLTDSFVNYVKFTGLDPELMRALLEAGRSFHLPLMGSNDDVKTAAGYLSLSIDGIMSSMRPVGRGWEEESGMGLGRGWEETSGMGGEEAVGTGRGWEEESGMGLGRGWEEASGMGGEGKAVGTGRGWEEESGMGLEKGKGWTEKSGMGNIEEEKWQPVLVSTGKQGGQPGKPLYQPAVGTPIVGQENPILGEKIAPSKKSQSDRKNYAQSIVDANRKYIMDSLFTTVQGKTTFSVNPTEESVYTELLMDIISQIREYDPTITKDEMIDLLFATIQWTAPNGAKIAGLSQFLRNFLDKNWK